MAEVSKLDLCFVCDTTGSMGGSILAVQRHLKKIAEALTASEKRDLMLACVEYKDHCDPVVVSSEDFTPSVTKVKKYIDKWTAWGGGDHPEAIASGLDAALKLSWRKDSTKMLVLCADAPPHGVGACGDKYPNGSPLGLDPLVIARELVQKEVIIYTVGVNAPDNYTVSFLCTLSRMSGGRYLPLAEASSLPTILLGGAEEEVELAKFEKLMDEEEEKVKRQAKESGEVLGEEEVSKRVAANLALKEVKVAQLQVTQMGGGAQWAKQEEFLSAQPTLSAYSAAQAQVDYSDIPSHGANNMFAAAYPPLAPSSGLAVEPTPMQQMQTPQQMMQPQMMQPQMMQPQMMQPQMMPQQMMPQQMMQPQMMQPQQAQQQAQQVQQVSDYIQAEQVMRHMQRKKC